MLYINIYAPSILGYFLNLHKKPTQATAATYMNTADVFLPPPVNKLVFFKYIYTFQAFKMFNYMLLH